MQAFLSKKQLPSVFITIWMSPMSKYLQKHGIGTEISAFIFPLNEKPRLFGKLYITPHVYNQFTKNIIKHLEEYSRE